MTELLGTGAVSSRRCISSCPSSPPERRGAWLNPGSRPGLRGERVCLPEGVNDVLSVGRPWRLALFGALLSPKSLVRSTTQPWSSARVPWRQASRSRRVLAQAVSRPLARREALPPLPALPAPYVWLLKPLRILEIVGKILVLASRAVSKLILPRVALGLNIRTGVVRLSRLPAQFVFGGQIQRGFISPLSLAAVLP